MPAACCLSGRDASPLASSPHPLPVMDFRPCLMHLASVLRPATPGMDRRSPDERCEGKLPSRLEDLEIGWRLDALDKDNKWFPATVVEVTTLMRMMRMMIGL